MYIYIHTYIYICVCVCEYIHVYVHGTVPGRLCSLHDCLATQLTSGMPEGQRRLSPAGFVELSGSGMARIKGIESPVLLDLD